MIWLAIALTAVGCYGLKAVGLWLPARLLEAPAVRSIAELLPVALLASLIITQTMTTAGRHLTVDPRLAGVAVAVIAAWRRAPFVVVIVAAAATAALVRAISG